jgi:toxin ParE1/3/4
MIYRVLLVEDAERDIEDIYGYIARRDSVERADAILDGLEETCASLRDFPERGNKPNELDALGIALYREIHFKPYRIIYRIIGRDVVIHGVFDGRRDMESLLQRRMLR